MIILLISTDYLGRERGQNHSLCCGKIIRWRVQRKTRGQTWNQRIKQLVLGFMYKFQVSVFFKLDFVKCLQLPMPTRATFGLQGYRKTSKTSPVGRLNLERKPPLDFARIISKRSLSRKEVRGLLFKRVNINEVPVFLECYLTFNHIRGCNICVEVLLIVYSRPFQHLQHLS